MAANITIAITAKDQYTDTLSKIKSTNQYFSKDLDGLNNKLNLLNNTKSVLKVDTDKARKALKDAAKDYEELANADNKTALELANSNYEQARRNLEEVGKAARGAQREISDLAVAQSKQSNRAGGLFGDGTIEKLAGAGVLKMGGDALAGISQAWITSAFGTPTGDAIASIASGATMGAAMGSIVPGIGTALGAAIGTGAGFVTGMTQIFTSQDEAFKSVVQSQVETQMQRLETDKTEGIQIAANRENSMISFTTLFGGDENRAGNYLEEIKTMANTTPFLYDDLAGMSKTLMAYGYGDEEGDLNAIDMMTAVGDTGAALGMDSANMNIIAQSLGRMNSSGKANLEYLKPLEERAVNINKYLSEGFNIPEDQIYDAISKGLIPGAEAAVVIKNALSADYGGSMEKMSHTYSGLSSTLQGANEEMQNAMGAGYIKEREKGLRAQIDHLGGESGEQMKDVNRMIGKYQADLDNQKEAAIRKAEQEVLDRIERDKLTEVEAGEALMAARIQAEADYAASEGATQYAEMQKSLAESARNIMIKDDVYKRFGYDMGQEFSKGMEAAVDETMPNILTSIMEQSQPAYKSMMDGYNPESAKSANQNGYAANADYYAAQRERYQNGGLLNKAFGLPYVPYDGYRARLHEGERVLTAQEARGYGKGGGGGVTVTGNTFTVREEADIDRIAAQLYAKIRQAQMIS